MMFDLSGRTALVTGAGQNVGAGIARALAGQGATVAVNDVRAERAEAVVKEITAAGGRAVAAPFDVTDVRAVTDAITGVTTAAGPIDILVNNAGNWGEGTIVLKPFRELAPEEWEAPIRVNLYGVLNCCRAVIDGMCERSWGRVITISSAAGTAGANIGISPYSAGKGAGIAFTRTLALEVARYGVTANTLALGLMTIGDATITGPMVKRIPLGRTGRPEDVAAACVWLASEEASWVTAQTIQVNGGTVPT
jgi:NAD(P)-dependent dehydrogenase (short-subunit alcohol dehydrogenase family)